jgi:hypothetical protein
MRRILLLILGLTILSGAAFAASSTPKPVKPVKTSKDDDFIETNKKTNPNAKVHVIIRVQNPAGLSKKAANANAKLLKLSSSQDFCRSASWA